MLNRKSTTPYIIHQLLKSFEHMGCLNDIATAETFKSSETHNPQTSDIPYLECFNNFPKQLNLNIIPDRVTLSKSCLLLFVSQHVYVRTTRKRSIVKELTA